MGEAHGEDRERVRNLIPLAKELGIPLPRLAIAWLLSAAVCALLLIFAQTTVYAPLGLTLNIFNPVPWLFTLPVPIAVLAATSGTVSRMLAKLDPISVIERRS